MKLPQKLPVITAKLPVITAKLPFWPNLSNNMDKNYPQNIVLYAKNTFYLQK
jgi:hypothetical protein